MLPGSTMPVSRRAFFALPISTAVIALAAAAEKPGIESKVREGYRSLAGRTQALFEEVRPYFHNLSETENHAFDRFSGKLGRISTTGDILSIGSETNMRIMDLLGQSIPYNYKPGNPTESFAMASLAVRMHHSIPDFRTLLERGRITEYALGTQPGLVSTASESGATERILYLVFDRARPVQSTLINLHELHHALQPEYARIEQIDQELQQVKGFAQLAAAVEASPELRERLATMHLISHQLRFWISPEVEALARENKITIGSLRTFLDEHIPTMDFLTCYTEGDAYLSQADIIVKNPDVAHVPVVAKVYQLIALTDALTAPFLEPKAAYNHVGIGLCEYLRGRPEAKKLAMGSQRFHQELSRTYFERHSTSS